MLYKNILVVDDDPAVRLEISNCFLASGEKYAVQFAAEGNTAIHILDSQRIHLLITELALPDIDGLSVLDFARNTCPPVATIVVTGHLNVFEDIARSMGAMAFFNKPVDCEDLLEKVNQIFRFKSITQNIGLSLVNILQATSTETASTVLMVATDKEKGKFFFKDGQLIDASCGGLSGEEAVNYMLSWGFCTCKHFPVEKPDDLPHKTIFKDMTTLLMNFAVQLDEKRFSTPS